MNMKLLLGASFIVLLNTAPVGAQTETGCYYLGNFPFPILDPFEHENYQYVLQRLGLHKQYGSLYERSARLADKSQLFGNAGLFQFRSASRGNIWLSQRMLEVATAIPVFTANQLTIVPLLFD